MKRSTEWTWRIVVMAARRAVNSVDVFAPAQNAWSVGKPLPVVLQSPALAVHDGKTLYAAVITPPEKKGSVQYLLGEIPLAGGPVRLCTLTMTILIQRIAGCSLWIFATRHAE